MDKIDQLGATVHRNGVYFKVWAPFAENVMVEGDFGPAVQMEKQGDYWSVDVPQAKVGHRYHYVITNNGQTFVRNDPRALELTKNEQNSVIVDPAFDWQGDNFKLVPSHELVIYELHVGTFFRPDVATPGKFEDVAAKLDYLVSLGVNAIELMPVTEFTTDRSWGYNPTHLYAVESTYGGFAALQSLVKQAHAKGIGVILDVVYNHMGPGDIGIWQFDGWHEGDRGGIYFFADDRAHTLWGDTRLDYGRPEVRQYIIDNALMWIRDCHIDGLRVDSTSQIRAVDDHGGAEIPEGWTLMQEMNKAIKAFKPDALLIAEDLKANEWLNKPVDEGGAGFDAQWDPWITFAIREQVQGPLDEYRTVSSICDSLKQRFNGDPFTRVIYIESHDADSNGHSRLPEEIAPGSAEGLEVRRRTALATAIMMTSPGIPMIFQGEEFVEGGHFTDIDYVDWSKSDINGGIRRLFKDLIQLRRNKDEATKGLTTGNINITQCDDASKVLAYHRWDQGGPGDDVIVVANFVNRAQEGYELWFPRTGTWRVRFNSDFKGYSEDFTNTLTTDVEVGDDNKGKVNLGPYSVVILSQDE